MVTLTTETVSVVPLPAVERTPLKGDLVNPLLLPEDLEGAALTDIQPPVHLPLVSATVVAAVATVVLVAAPVQPAALADPLDLLGCTEALYPRPVLPPLAVEVPVVPTTV